MGITDSLKDAYFKIEDKWYNFVDRVSEMLPIFGNAVDAVEEKGIPSLPLAIAIIILLIFGIYLVFMMGASSTLTIVVKDAGENPLADAEVTVFLNGIAQNPRSTDADGRVAIYLANGNYKIKIGKENYSPQDLDITVNGSEEKKIILLPEDTTIAKMVKLKTANGALIPGNGTVVYSCEETGESGVTTYANGEFKAAFKNPCQTIVTESVSGYDVTSGRISFSGAYDTVELEEKIVGTGKVIVNLSSNSADNPVHAGIKVMLISIDSSVLPITEPTQTETVEFLNVPTGSYKVVVSDPEGKFAEVDSSALEQPKTVSKDGVTTFNIALQKSASAEIRISILDASTSVPIMGAEVRLIKDNTTLNTEITGTTGQVTFKIVEGSVYSLQVDHPDYLRADELSVSSAKPSIQINLTRANETNARTLAVTVVDPDNLVIEGVKVFLRKTDETQVGEPKVTGADGKVEFYNLDLGQTYYVYAIKEGFEGANSSTIQITPRVENNLKVTLNIGKGIINISVMDAEKAAVVGATVTAIDYFTGKQIEKVSQQVTSASGTASFEIRADKKVYFTVEATGYMKHYTSSVYPNVGAPTEKEVVLVRETGALSAEIIGIYSGSQIVSSTDKSIAQGTYTVKAVLVVPKGSFSEAGLHLRTGKAENGKTNLMEEDSIYLGRIASSATKTVRGTTYTPPSGYDADQKNLTSGNSKWANSVWKNPSGGAYEVEAELVVTATNTGMALDLWYRAWAKGSSMLRYPSDAPQQDLYAKANRYVLSSDATNLCIASFCRSYYIETLSGGDKGKKNYITNTFEAKNDTNYALIFTLTNNTGRAIADALLNIDGKSLSIDGIEVDGKKVESPVSLGALGKDSFTSGRILFSTIKSGVATIRLLVNSSAKNEFDETVTVKVPANKKFSLSIIPAEIIPYLDNTMFFEAKDDNAMLDNAVIEIYSGKSLIGTVETNEEGIAQYELEAPSPGTTIKVVAKKEGYDKVEIEKEVDEQILTVIPPEITGTIKIGEVIGMEQEVIVENGTVKDLKITSAKFEGDMTSLLNLSFKDSIEGATIKSAGDKNFMLSIKITKAAYRLTAPQTVTGKMIIDAGVLGDDKEVIQTFTNEIPVSIRLTLPGYIESDGCLTVTPGTVEFMTGSDEVVQTVEIENGCSAEGITIPLHGLEVKLKDESKFGNVSIVGMSAAFSAVQLSAKPSVLAEFLEKSTKETLTIKFTPSKTIESGKQENVITFSAKNMPEEGVEETVEAKVNLKITMSNLAQCIKVEEPPGGVILEVAAFNMGYDRLAQTSLAPQLGAYAQTYQGFSNRSGMTNPYGMGTGTINGLQYANYGSQGASTYEQNSFVIKSTCATDVDIDLDPDSRVVVDEEKFTIGAESDHTVTVSPGYTLGRYKVKVNAKVSQTENSFQNVATVSVTVKKLGDDDDCIKVSVSKLNFNSFVQSPENYRVYNYCYDLGTALSRNPNAVSISCVAPQSPINAGYADPYFMVGQSQLYQNNYPLYGGGAGTELVDYPGIRQGTTPYYYGYGQGTPTASNYTQNSSYYDYLRPNGTCMQNNCSMVSGTRIVNRRLIEGGPNGSIEEIVFEVRPSTSYIPQRKIQNAQTGTYSPISTIMMLRNFATAADARTNIYGTINVEYTDKYASEQCKQFPVEMQDMWGLAEMLDSALGNGDPSVESADCVEPSALDIVSFFKRKDSSNTTGVIPDGKFNGKSYLHIAEPPAIKIGGAGSTSFLGMGITKSSGKCGLNDKLTNVKVGSTTSYGVSFKVESTSGSGSGFLNPGKGPNLVVEINKSGLTANCAYIEVPVTATLKRNANMKSAEVSWTLKVLVAKDGYKITSLDECQNGAAAKKKEDCLKLLAEEKTKGSSKDKKASDIIAAVVAAHSECKGLLNESDVTTPPAKEGTCKTKAKDYGFELIKTENSLVESKMVNCKEFFCNYDQLNVFLFKNYKEIDKNIQEMKGKKQICTNESNGYKLSEIYKEAKTATIFLCDKGGAIKNDLNFYLAADTEGKSNDPVTLDYSLPLKEALTTDQLAAIKNKTDGQYAAMIKLINAIDKAGDLDKYLIKIPADATANKTFLLLGMKEINGNYYMPLRNYRQVLEAVVSKAGTACATPGADCEITVKCTNISPDTKILLKNAAIEHLASATLIKGVLQNGNGGLSQAEIEKIYVQNPALNEIRKLANNVLLLTTIKPTEENKNNFEIWVDDQTFSDSIAEKLKEFILETPVHELEFKSGNTAPGKYDVNMDYEYCKGESPMAVNVGDKKVVDGAAEAGKNILLQTGYKVNKIEGSLRDSESNTIVAANGDFYLRTPVKITVTTGMGESGFDYFLKDGPKGVPDNLITWRTSNDAIFSKGKGIGGSKFRVEIKAGSATTLKGIYYYPDQGSMIFEGGNASERTINASDPIGKGNQFGTSNQVLQISGDATLATPSLEEVIGYVKGGDKACIAEDGSYLYWNESELIKK